MLKVVKEEMAMMAKLLLSHKYLLHMSRAFIYNAFDRRYDTPEWHGVGIGL
jgi:hypothetical protein